MAVELKRYEQQVGISGQGVGVEGSVSLAGKAAAAEYLVSADMIATLGDAAGEYIKKKQRVKDAADSADYKTRLLKFNTDLATAKGKAMEDQVPYGEIYQTTYEPMMQQFEHDIYNAGYSRDILVAAQQNWAYDKASIRQKDVTDVERMDLANLKNKIGNSILDRVAIGYMLRDENGELINPDGDEDINDSVQHLSGLIGAEGASMFLETAIAKNLSDKIALAGEGGTVYQQLEAVDQARLAARNLSPDVLADLELVASSKEQAIVTAYLAKLTDATQEVTELIADGSFNGERYEAIKVDLDPTQRAFLDNHIVEVSANRARSLRKTPEGRETDTLMVMDLVSRWQDGESLIKRGWWARKFTTKDEPLTYKEVFKEGMKLGTEAQALLFIVMGQAFRTMAKDKTPLETFTALDAKHYDRKYPIRPVVKTIEFDAQGGDFLAEVFHYSKYYDDKLTWMRGAFKEWTAFERLYPNGATEEQYLVLKKSIFGQGVSNDLKNVLDVWAGTTLTDVERDLYKKHDK